MNCITYACLCLWLALQKNTTRWWHHSSLHAGIHSYKQYKWEREKHYQESVLASFYLCSMPRVCFLLFSVDFWFFDFLIFFVYYSFNQAYEQGIHLPRYLLLTLGWYSRFWWRENDAQLTCTVAQRESVLRDSLVFVQDEFLNSSSPTDLNFTSSTGIVSERGTGPLPLLVVAPRH